MNTLVLAPAVRQLLLYQSLARSKRLLRGFTSPRRLALSCLGVLLTVVWLGQALLGVLFRQPADPSQLARWIPLGLLAYALWHVLKTICRSPVEPFEWTPAERELLGSAPLSRAQLVSYRFAAIAGASVIKAACFTFVMLPDLRIPAAGFLGMLLALIFLDLVRMALEVSVHGLPQKARIRWRIVALAVAATGVVSAMTLALCTPVNPAAGETSPALGLLLDFFAALIHLRTTWVGTAAELPFHVFSNVILADTVHLGLALSLLLAAAMVTVLASVVVWLDDYWMRVRLGAERLRCGEIRAASDNDVQTSAIRRGRLLVPIRCWGAGTLAWRQALGAGHYQTSILFSLVVPALLSCIPLLVPRDAASTLVHVVGSLVFYSFLLLPTALKLDFRRDLDRMAAIKSLPIRPAAVTVGQLVMPVFLCTIFQTAVLLVVMFVRPYPPQLLLISLALLVPVNILIFAMENLIFLLYPYRLSEEGVAIFVRSILTFTAKGVFFAVGLAATWAWLRLATSDLLVETPGAKQTLFMAGMWLLTCTLAWSTTLILVRAYQRFDPSQDTPA